MRSEWIGRLGGAAAIVVVFGCAGSDGDGAGGDGDTSAGGEGNTGADTSSGATGGADATGGATGGADATGGATGGADATGGVDPGTTAIPDIPEVPSVGCGTMDPPSGEINITVGADQRMYIVSLPDEYDASHPYPVIFGFHGRGGSADGVTNNYYLGLEVPGGTPSIFVYPDGLPDDNDQKGWPNTNGRDVAFFDAILAELATGYCIDENRVFSTGHSYGGMMSHTLACERASVLRAVAPVAGAMFFGGNCSGQIAALGIHGNPDGTVDYEQGLSAIERLIEANGCDESSTAPYEPTDHCTSYACAAGYPVVWCEHQEDHAWPDFASATIKAFFDRF